MDSRRTRGGIVRVLELAEKHPAEIRADFRTLYNVSFDDVGGKVKWIEAIYLVSMLMRNPQSWLQAAVNGWKYPVDNAYMMLAETYDLLARVNSKNKPKPIPRPWPDTNKTKIGSTTRTREEIEARLNSSKPKD